MQSGLLFTDYSLKKIEEYQLTREQVLYSILNGDPKIIDDEFIQFCWKGIIVTTCLEIRTVFTLQRFEIRDDQSASLSKVHYSEYELSMCA